MKYLTLEDSYEVRTVAIVIKCIFLMEADSYGRLFQLLDVANRKILLKTSHTHGN